MINIFEALGWLNAIDTSSCLNDETRRLINFASRFTPRDSRVQRILERLRNSARSSGNPLEKAEILLHCAAMGSWRGCFPQAACDAREAVIAYDRDEHRRAIALWILGMTQWRMFQNHDAYRSWADAREILEQCKILFQNFPNEKVWYRDRVHRMKVDLATHPEEIWTWLNWFERPCLRPPTKQIVDSVQVRIRQQAYSNVYALMQDFQETIRPCEGVYERAEVYLEFGLAMYQMGNTHFSIELLRKAVLHYFPGVETYHKQVVARCMLGAVEWMNDPSHEQADADWSRCIEEFERLRSWASEDNHQKKRDWYTEHRAILYDALLDKRRQNPKPVDPDRTISEGTSPTPDPSTPPGKTNYSYEVLLRKVRWDRATADRLIEYERKMTPKADRNEWIKRAIERWLRDNR